MNEMEPVDQEAFEVEMLENVANKEDLIRVNFFQKFVVIIEGPGSEEPVFDNN